MSGRGEGRVEGREGEGRGAGQGFGGAEGVVRANKKEGAQCPDFGDIARSNEGEGCGGRGGAGSRREVGVEGGRVTGQGGGN